MPDLSFVKMHGAGNDFVMLNAINDSLPKDLTAFSKTICHRHFGVGADQVLIAYPSESADFRMDIYNADGGAVEMCGNGIRCFIKYVRDLGLSDKTEMVIETLAGPIKPKMICDHAQKTDDTEWVRVDMGPAELDGRQIPVAHDGPVQKLKWTPRDTSSFLASDAKEFQINAVSMGNPHCVIFVDDVQNYPVERIGPVIENDPFFPNRVNVEFVQVINRQSLIQRTWERGSGETYACGTGASAVAVAAIRNDLCESKVQIKLKGGALDIEWDQTHNVVYMTGPATTVFAGKIKI